MGRPVPDHLNRGASPVVDKIYETEYDKNANLHRLGLSAEGGSGF
jgi:hypothetical protein